MEKRGRPHEIIAAIVAKWEARSDDEVLAALRQIPQLADEEDACWKDDAFWMAVAYPYVALADVAALRRLRPAIELLLERACFGDPGEIMRGLRHNLEAIVNPDWDALTAACLAAAESSRRGTRLWAIDQLTVLDAPRAKFVFERALRDESAEVRSLGRIGLDRLASRGGVGG